MEYLIIDINTGTLLSSLIGKDNPLMPYEIYYLGSGGYYAATCFHYCKAHKYEIENSSNNVEGSLKYAYHWDSYSGEPTCIKSWNSKYQIDNITLNKNYSYTNSLLLRFKELNMQKQNKAPAFNYSRLSAELNYANNPKQALTTGSSPNAPYILPSVAKKIIQDAQKLGIK